MDALIFNSDDLRAEIARLKVTKKIQEEAIASHFNSPSAIFHTITSAFKGSPSDKKAGGLGGILGGGQDVVSLLSRFVLPFVLNKTLFRGSNFIIKTAVGLLSQKASGFINEKSVMSVWDKVKSFIPGKNKVVINRKPTRPNHGLEGIDGY